MLTDWHWGEGSTHGQKMNEHLSHKDEMKNRFSGFTILELMLVMIVFSVMAMYAFNMLKNRQNNYAVAQTVTQFKNLLQQAALYQQNTGEFAKDANELIDANYIQPEDLCSNWSGTKSGNQVCPNKANFVIGNQGNDVVVVSLTLSSIQQNMASAITSQIPSGAVDPKTNTIFAYQVVQTRPTLYTEDLSTNVFGYLTNAGFVECKNSKGYNKASDCSSIALASPCPEGYEGHFILSPYQFSTDRRQFRAGFLGFLRKTKKKFYVMSFGGSSAVLNPDSDNPSFVVSDDSFVQYTEQSNSDWGSNVAKAQYLVMCIPVGHWSSAASLRSLVSGWVTGTNTPRVTRRKLNCGKFGNCAGQCDNLWYKAYNNPSYQCGGKSGPLCCGKAPGSF